MKKQKKNKFKKIIYYIFLTSAFIILPMSIRNIRYSILLNKNLSGLIIDILLNILIFIYPFTIALIIRHHEKTGKWLLPKFLREDFDELNN